MVLEDNHNIPQRAIEALQLGLDQVLNQVAILRAKFQRSK
jgi:hypothetical protein